MLKISLQAGKTPQLGKGLLCKHKELSSDPQHPSKKISTVCPNLSAEDGGIHTEGNLVHAGQPEQPISKLHVQ